MTATAKATIDIEITSVQAASRNSSPSSTAKRGTNMCVREMLAMLTDHHRDRHPGEQRICVSAGPEASDHYPLK